MFLDPKPRDRLVQALPSTLDSVRQPHETLNNGKGNKPVYLRQISEFGIIVAQWAAPAWAQSRVCQC